MVLTKEYRICMPLTTEEYRIGQLYMIARHSHEQSDNDEGVEVVENVKCDHPDHGKGQYTEKRIHLSSKLPYWIQSVIPRIFYVTEKAWNYYPFTITEYTCSFIPKFNISIRTRYEDNNGSSENCLGLSPIELIHREVDFVDIAYDEISAKHYKEEEDPKFYQSKRTCRGPLIEGWRETTQPIMCSYKLVHSSFEVWGMQTRVEDFIHRYNHIVNAPKKRKKKLKVGKLVGLERKREEIGPPLQSPICNSGARVLTNVFIYLHFYPPLFNCIRDILLLGHRQAFAWIDEWYDMTMEDVREYETKMHAETNEKVRLRNEDNGKPLTPTTPSTSVPSSPQPKSPTQSNRSWFSWS